MTQFNPGESVWFVRTKHREEGHNCPSCHCYVTKTFKTKEVAQAEISTITHQRSLHNKERTSYTLYDPDLETYVVWDAVFKTKEEAESLLATMTTESVSVVSDRDGENY